MGCGRYFDTHQPCTKRRQTSTRKGAITVREIIRIQSSPGMIVHRIVELKIMKKESLGLAYFSCSDEKTLVHPRIGRGPCFILVKL
ncbi:hypothetical protein Csa_023952 [Cucumis sativus]|nr:hypothetical protein Csa_023952 [Cucumis sativus]